MKPPTDWIRTSWSAIADLKYGRALRDYRDSGGSVQVFGTNGPVGFTSVRQAAGPGVVIGRKGAYRGVHYSKSDFWVIDTAFYLLPTSEMNMRWAYYALTLADINGLDSGSAIPSTTRESFGSLQVWFPPLREQQAIAEVLGALDDKIAANTRLAVAADDLYQHRFTLASLKASASPRLSELVTTQYGLTASASDGDGPKLLRVTDINKTPWVNWETVPSTNASEKDLSKYLLRAGDVVVARMADPGKPAIVDPGHPVGVFASYLVRLRPIDPQLGTYLYGFLRSAEYRSYADSASQGTVQRNINARLLVDVSIPMPPKEVLATFAEGASSLRALIGAYVAENRTLAATRDALLPKLMSGQLRVSDAEKFVERAGA